MIPSFSTISYEKSFPEAGKYSQTQLLDIIDYDLIKKGIYM